MYCKPDPFPWWSTLVVSGFVVISTFLLGISRWLAKIYFRHQRYKNTVAINSKRSMYISQKVKYRKRTFSSPSIAEGEGDYNDEVGDVLGEEDMDFDDSDYNDDRYDEGACIYANTFVQLRRLSKHQRIHDLRKSETFCIGDKRKRHKKYRSKVANGAVIKQIFPSQINTHEIEVSEEDLNKKCVWFWRWLQDSRLGMSARQQLNMKLYCEQYTTVSYPSGKIMLSVYIALSTFSWLFYIIETKDEPPVSIRGICHTLRSRILCWLNFCINLFFLGYYILKLCAATDRIRFVLSFSSLIDIVAIPPALLAVFETQRHFDFNFLRAMCILNYVDVLTFMGVITSNQSIQSARITFTLLTIWMVGSGIMHLIEHLGDFWLEENHAGTWTYFETCYFLLVSLSTVGYGDYVTHTTLGKLFICIFIPVAMVKLLILRSSSSPPPPPLSTGPGNGYNVMSQQKGVSASFVPELFRNFNNNATNASDRYEPISGERHVIVCGHFNNDSIRAFINGFLHGCRSKGRVRINMVLLRPFPLDFALKAILSPYHAWVRYFVGTPNNPHDLLRTKLKNACAAIVLATPNSKNRDDEDGANIMQAIALKARKKNLRVLLQLHYFRNKCLINNFPRWTYLANDMVICMEELKLGLMAYNCMAPGFSTLIVNLLNSHRSNALKFGFEHWRLEYDYGFKMQMHDVGISHEFSNVFMRDIAIFIYEKWNLILLAVLHTSMENMSMIINPIEVNCLVNTNSMRAIVIAKDYSSALKLEYYCITCEGHLLGHSCRCRRPVHEKHQKLPIPRDLALYEQIGQARENAVKAESTSNGYVTMPLIRHSYTSSLLDLSTNDWDEPTDFFSRTLNDQNSLGNEKFKKSFYLMKNKVFPKCSQVSTIVSVPQYDRTGSFHWVPDVPLSRATLTPNQAAEMCFRKHFLVCVVGKSIDEPLNLENFILPLRFHWQTVRDIVILGNSQLIGSPEWVKLKNLPKIYMVDGNPCSFNDLHSVHLCHCSACVVLGSNAEEPPSTIVDASLQDRVTLLCAMNIQSLLKREQHLIHLTTELRYEKNAFLFSSGDTHECDYKLPVWLSEPFARGVIFSNSLLYSCLSSFYYNDNVFRFLRVLISGQSTDELEASFSVGAGLQQGFLEQSRRMAGVKVALRGFQHPPFKFFHREPLNKPLTFRDVYLRCLTCWQILCLGLYRWHERGFRYVLANPSPDTQVYADDMFFCFMPINRKSWKFSELLVPNTEKS